MMATHVGFINIFSHILSLGKHSSFSEIYCGWVKRGKHFWRTIEWHLLPKPIPSALGQQAWPRIRAYSKWAKVSQEFTIFHDKNQKHWNCPFYLNYFLWMIFVLVLFQFWCRIAFCPLQIDIWQHQCCRCFQRKWCPGCCRDPHPRGNPMGSICSRQASSKWRDAKKVCTEAFQALEGTRGTISWVGSGTRSIHLWNHVS